MKVLISNKGRRFRLGALEKWAKLSNGEARAFKLRGCLDLERDRAEFLISKGFAKSLRPVDPIIEVAPPEPVVTQVITEMVTQDVVVDHPVEIPTAPEKSGNNGPRPRRDKK